MIELGASQRICDRAHDCSLLPS